MLRNIRFTIGSNDLLNAGFGNLIHYTSPRFSIEPFAKPNNSSSETCFRGAFSFLLASYQQKLIEAYFDEILWNLIYMQKQSPKGGEINKNK